MEITVRVRNYRCFADTPIEFKLRRGFTALVGKNNSGKSTLLKLLFEFRQIFRQLSDRNTIQNVARSEDYNFGFQVEQIHDRAALLFNQGEGDIEITLLPSDESWTKHLRIGRITITIQRANPASAKARLFFHDGAPVGTPGKIGPDGVIKDGDRTISADYIQQTMLAMADTLYIGPFRNAINVGSQDNYFDIKVGQAFVKQWRQWKTGQFVRQNEVIYELTNEIARIFEYSRLEINPTEDDQTLQIFINGRSYRLAELGGGVAQFIVVLGNAATRKSSFILIDEPELNLHPALQLDFLTTLGAYSTEGVAFATHSLGLARTAAQAIYTFEKQGTGDSKVRLLEALPSLAEFAGALSFSGQPELGFDRILLVEGRTETAAIQQLLRLYGKEHVAMLLPLGGDSLINEHPSTEAQLEELKRITANLFGLIDSERTAAGAALSPSREGFAKICKKVGINLHVFERRALENYFTQRALDAAFKSGQYTEMGPYDPTPRWNKNDNWRVTREMTKPEIDGTDLGAFLATL